WLALDWTKACVPTAHLAVLWASRLSCAVKAKHLCHHSVNEYSLTGVIQWTVSQQEENSAELSDGCLRSGFRCGFPEQTKRTRRMIRPSVDGFSLKPHRPGSNMKSTGRPWRVLLAANGGNEETTSGPARREDNSGSSTKATTLTRSRCSSPEPGRVP